MNLAYTKLISVPLLVVVFATGLLATTSIGCGDDDDENDTPDASSLDSGQEGASGKGGASGKAGASGKGGSGGTGGTLVPPANSEECKANMRRDAPQDVDERTDCLCEKCFDVWVDCLMDPGCQVLMRCVRDNNCISLNCALQKCPEEISKYNTSLLWSERVSECNNRVRCDLAGQIIDSGIPDSGNMTDSGM